MPLVTQRGETKDAARLNCLPFNRDGLLKGQFNHQSLWREGKPSYKVLCETMLPPELRILASLLSNAPFPLCCPSRSFLTFIFLLPQP